MTAETAQAEIENVIKKFRAQLDSAAALAKQAEVCVAKGNTDQAPNNRVRCCSTDL
jgi:hypothetical protein